MLVREANKLGYGKNSYKLLKELNVFLGILDEDTIKISKEIIELAEKRLNARNEKNWKEADKLRELIKTKGFLIEDTETSYKFKKL